MTPSKSRPNGSGSAAFLALAFCLSASCLRRRLVVLGGAQQNQVALLLRQLLERRLRIDAVVRRNGGDGFLLGLALAPRRDRAAGERQRIVGDDAQRIEVPGRPEALARRARAVRRVERERARRHFRNADAAHDARELARKQAIAAVERIDHHHVVGELQRHLDRLGEPPLDAAPDDQPVDDDLDVVVAAAIEGDVFLERTQLAVDARLGEAARAQRLELLLELALAAADDRRHHVDARVLRVGHHQVDDALERLRRDLPAAVRAVRHADVGEEQPEIVVDFGDGADRRARIRTGRLLLDRNRRRQTLRSGRRPASPSARGTAARRPTATRRSGAGPRRRACRTRARTCPSPTAR